MKEMNWESIGIGEYVRLKYTGYARVPKWLSGSWAKVLKRNQKGNLVVQAEGELEGYTRTIQPSDVSDHMKSWN